LTTLSLEKKFISAVAQNSPIEIIEQLVVEILTAVEIEEFKLSWLDDDQYEHEWLEKNYNYDFSFSSLKFQYESENIAILYCRDYSKLHEIENILKAAIIHCYLVIVRQNKIDKELLKKDLEVAAKMQQLLIPKNLFSNQYFIASGLYLPNYKVGGDFYDVFQIDNHKTGFCIGDISGKGINAAIIMSHFIGYIQATLKNNELLEEAIVKINHKIYSLTAGEKFITLFIGVYNNEDKRLIYINSGHVSIPLYTKDKFEWLETGTTILGMFPKLPFIELGKKYIEEKTQIFLFTDGLQNLNIDHERFLSDKELTYILNTECLGKSTVEIIDYFREKVKTIEVDDDIKDDISVLAIELN
jgi:phosphoserine phosphatase RsbU/P